MILALLLVLALGGYANTVEREQYRCNPGDQWLERCHDVPIGGYSRAWGGFDAR